MADLYIRGMREAVMPGIGTQGRASQLLRQRLSAWSLWRCDLGSAAGLPVCKDRKRETTPPYSSLSTATSRTWLSWPLLSQGFLCALKSRGHRLSPSPHSLGGAFSALRFLSGIAFNHPTLHRAKGFPQTVIYFLFS